MGDHCTRTHTLWHHTSGSQRCQEHWHNAHSVFVFQGSVRKHKSTQRRLRPTTLQSARSSGRPPLVWFHAVSRVAAVVADELAHGHLDHLRPRPTFLCGDGVDLGDQVKGEVNARGCRFPRSLGAGLASGASAVNASTLPRLYDCHAQSPRRAVSWSVSPGSDRSSLPRRPEPGGGQ